MGEEWRLGSQKWKGKEGGGSRVVVARSRKCKGESVLKDTKPKLKKVPILACETKEERRIQNSA